jgi:hypothetical protein
MDKVRREAGRTSGGRGREEQAVWKTELIGLKQTVGRKASETCTQTYTNVNKCTQMYTNVHKRTQTYTNVHELKESYQFKTNVIRY